MTLTNQFNTTEGLRECPMCGGKADYNWDERDDGIRAWYIHCAPDDSFKGCIAHDGRFATLKQATTHWNTRTSNWQEIAEKQREVIAELVAAMNKSVDMGCTDHLDACDDVGAFWHDALSRATEVL